MKIVLLEDIKKLGKKYDVKDVSPGYARNFLIPHKLARPADEAALKLKTQFQVKEAGLYEEAASQAKKLENEPLVFQIKTGERGEIFSSVNEKQIKKTLQNRGFSDFEIELKRPLRSLGEHTVEIMFKRGIKGVLKVILEPN